MSKETFGDQGGLIRMLTGRPSYPRSVMMRLNRTLKKRSCWTTISVRRRCRSEATAQRRAPRMGGGPPLLSVPVRDEKETTLIVEQGVRPGRPQVVPRV